MAANEYEAGINYYDILGISESASEVEIKKAYHKRALATHPDKHPGNKQKEAEFKLISKAYTVLSNPALKAAYDESRKNSNSLSKAAQGSAAAASRDEEKRAYYSHANALMYGSSSADSSSSASSLNVNSLQKCKMKVYISPALIRENFIRDAKPVQVRKSAATTFEKNFKDGDYINIEELAYNDAEKCLIFTARKANNELDSTYRVVYTINADALPLVVQQEGKYHHIGIIAASKKGSAAVFSHYSNLEEEKIISQMESQWKNHWDQYADHMKPKKLPFEVSSKFELPLTAEERKDAQTVMADLSSRTFSRDEQIRAITIALDHDSRKELQTAYTMEINPFRRIGLFGNSEEKATQVRQALVQKKEEEKAGASLAITYEKK